MSLENIGIIVSIVATFIAGIIGYFIRESGHKEKNHQLELRIQRLEDKLESNNQIFNVLKEMVARQIPKNLKNKSDQPRRGQNNA